MIHTPVCDLFNIEHPIALGGMGSVYSLDLVAAVSNAGGFGAMGCHRLNAEQILASTAGLRERTNKPFALNFLLFDVVEERFAAALALRPKVIAFAWPWPGQDLKSYVGRAHDAGCKVTFMANGVPEAVKAAEAGADVIIAQGTEGGGHVGWVTSMVLTPMVVDAVAPIPVLTAGGVADGRGLAAAIALGADGVLLGTRFLASVESPLHPNFTQAIIDSGASLMSPAFRAAWIEARASACREHSSHSRPAHRSMNRLRRERDIAPGQTLPAAMSGISDSAVSWPSESTIACLKFWCSGDSTVARKRVPSSTPSAPSAIAAASPRPSATPPAVSTGIGATASTTIGVSTMLVIQPT